MKLKGIIALVCITAVVFGATGAIAATNLEPIKANLNRGITIFLNGKIWKPKDVKGDVVTPITYNGTTYVPLRAISEISDKIVEWDEKSQYILIGQKAVWTNLLSPLIKLQDTPDTFAVIKDEYQLTFFGQKFSSAYRMHTKDKDKQSFSIKLDKPYTTMKVQYAVQSNAITDGYFKIYDEKGTLLYEAVSLPIGLTNIDFSLYGATTLTFELKDNKYTKKTNFYVLTNETGVR